MKLILALLPSSAVLVAVLGLRASGPVAAGTALFASVAVWLSGAFSTPSEVQMVHAFADGLVLTALVAAMIVPGMLFVEATRPAKAPEAIKALIAKIGGPQERRVVLIATGIGVMVESLTGMGVSLLVTMPLLLALLPKSQAIGAGLVGMSLMPWGALSISAHVSAKLSGLGMTALQGWFVVVSGPVAFLLPLWCLGFAGGWRPSKMAFAILAGAVLWASIWAATVTVGVEIAGVAGGLSIVVLCVLLAPSFNGLGRAIAAPGLLPYGVLLATVVAQKLAVAPLDRLGLSPALATDRVSFAVMTSPGVALLATVLSTSLRRMTPALVFTVLQRSWRPVFAVALFMIAARLTVECGAIATLADSLSGLGRVGATLAVAFLAAVGGFVTGSAVTSTALFMPSAAAAGTAIGALPILAALQNGVSGHVAMASLPVAAVLLATLPDRRAEDSATVMRIALRLALAHTVVATVSALTAMLCIGS